MALLCGYCELEGPPQHSSDVFFHGETIFDSAASVWALYRSIPLPQCWKVGKEFSKILSICIGFHWISMVFIGFYWFSLNYSWFSLFSFEPCIIRSMKSIDRVPKQSRHYQKWIPHDKIRRSCGAVVLLAHNSRRARAFWKSKLHCKKKYNSQAPLKNKRN